MTMKATPTSNSVHKTDAACGLTVVRVTIGAMLVWVFFENLGKGLYTAGGHAGLIHYYIAKGHARAAWKTVEALAANHAANGSPAAGGNRNLVRGAAGYWPVLRVLIAFFSFLYLGSLWMSEWGTAWIWELLVPVLASLGLAIGRAGRPWGVDGWLAERWPDAPWWLL